LARTTSRSVATCMTTSPSGRLLQVDGNNTFNTDAWAVFTHLNYRLSDFSA
jgi:hypothetical protein